MTYINVGLTTKSVRFGQKPLAKKMQGIFGRTSKEAIQLYHTAQRHITERVKKHQKAGQKLDLDAYKKIVTDVIQELKPNDQYLKTRMDTLADHFVEEYNKPKKPRKTVKNSN